MYGVGYKLDRGAPVRASLLTRLLAGVDPGRGAGDRRDRVAGRAHHDRRHRAGAGPGDRRRHDIYTSCWSTRPPTRPGPGSARRCERSRTTGRRIALLDRRPDADRRLGHRQGKLPNAASAVVDPLRGPGAGPNAPADRIARRGLGPFPLSAGTGAPRRAGQAAARCVRAARGTATVVPTPAGRRGSRAPTRLRRRVQRQWPSPDPTTTEQMALDQLTTLVNGCLARSKVPEVRVALDRSRAARLHLGAPAQGREYEQHRAGLPVRARQEQLAPYVAPSALVVPHDDHRCGAAVAVRPVGGEPDPDRAAAAAAAHA